MAIPTSRAAQLLDQTTNANVAAAMCTTPTEKPTIVRRNRRKDAQATRYGSGRGGGATR
jgi:hypothetical protein